MQHLVPLHMLAESLGGEAGSRKTLSLEMACTSWEKGSRKISVGDVSCLGPHPAPSPGLAWWENNKHWCLFLTHLGG